MEPRLCNISVSLLLTWIWCSLGNKGTIKLFFLHPKSANWDNQARLLINLVPINFSYCYDHVQMRIVITKRSGVYIVAFHLYWIVALEACCRNSYWSGRAEGSCVWLFMWGLTWAGSIRPQGWELHACMYVSMRHTRKVTPINSKKKEKKIWIDDIL